MSHVMTSLIMITGVQKIRTGKIWKVLKNPVKRWKTRKALGNFGHIFSRQYCGFFQPPEIDTSRETRWLRTLASVKEIFSQKVFLYSFE